MFSASGLSGSQLPPTAKPYRPELHTLTPANRCMNRKRPAFAVLRAFKGKHQLSLLRFFSLEEAEAVQQAGIVIVSMPPELFTHPYYRKVAPSLFSMIGKTHLEYGSRGVYLKYCGEMIQAGADAVYCSGSLETAAFVAREHIPVFGHVGLVPSRAT
jgi:3-methyl-2-oxobutanoate hydroxymethyltransferase